MLARERCPRELSATLPRLPKGNGRAVRFIFRSHCETRKRRTKFALRTYLFLVLTPPVISTKGVARTEKSLVSKTALPFFEGRGYKIIAPQRVVRHDVEIENFAMLKRG